MTAETSNARGEWVLVPREPTAEMVQASDEISCRAEGAEHWAAMLAAAPPPSAPVGVDAPGSRSWMAEVCRAAALSLAAHGVRNDQLSKVADWIAQQPAAVDGAKETDLWRCTVCGRVGTVGRCCGEETREPFRPNTQVQPCREAASAQQPGGSDNDR